MNRYKLEENSNQLSQTLMNLLNEYGLYKTLIFTGLDVIQLFERIGPMIINADLSYEIILEIFTKYHNKVLRTQIDNYDLYYDPLNGTIRWVYTDDIRKEKMYALCTPFWDGIPWIPINIDEYILDGQSIEPNSEYTIKAPDEFHNIKQIINWYNDFYIPSVYKVLNKFLIKYRTEGNS